MHSAKDLCMVTIFSRKLREMKIVAYAKHIKPCHLSLLHVWERRFFYCLHLVQ